MRGSRCARTYDLGCFAALAMTEKLQYVIASRNAVTTWRPRYMFSVRGLTQGVCRCPRTYDLGCFAALAMTEKLQYVIASRNAVTTWRPSACPVHFMPSRFITAAKSRSSESTRLAFSLSRAISASFSLTSACKP
jgi:hypothetical protein